MPSRPALSQRIAAGIHSIGARLTGFAKLAGYQAAMPDAVKPPASRLGTNPNSTFSRLQAMRLSLEAMEAVKNGSFARNLVNKRRMYCSTGISYAAGTGDHALDEVVNAYCREKWKRMGINCSMQQAFSRLADAFLPQYGDCAARWYRDEDDLRLLEISGDRIGEFYRFVRPQVVKSGEQYFAGIFFSGPNVSAYKIFDRVDDSTYVGGERVEAYDVMFFKDDITGGVRGVSLFAAALDDIRSGYEILKSTKDTMQQQSKIAAIASNESGSSDDTIYATTNTDRTVQYQETFADGAVLKYQFNGDSYQVLRAEHPSGDFIGALRYLNQNGSLACGFPYEFLYSGAESGGAPFRGAFEAAGREIMRLREDVHRPKLDIISYVTIMDAVERKRLPAVRNIARGTWQFGTLPTADAFRDDQSDKNAVRAGLTSAQRVIQANLGTTAEVIIRETKSFAKLVSKAWQDGNAELEMEISPVTGKPYRGDLTVADIAQITDNPQHAAAAENIEQGKPAAG